MTLNITITEVTNQDYDGIDETVKEVTCEINGVKLKEYYCYENTVENATINSEVEADLTAKGYSW